MRFDLPDLKLFLAICEAGSISKGAEAAHMSIASASARVSGMEALLGTPLLERNSNGTTVTAAGRTLAIHARAIVTQFERMRGDLRSFSSGLKGEILVSSNTGALIELLPVTLSAFLKKHPDINVHLQEKSSVETVSDLRAGRAEVGFIAATANYRGLECKRLINERIGVVVSRKNPLSAKATISISDTLDERFVGVRGPLHSRVVSEAEKLGRRLDQRVMLNTLDSALMLVEADVGIAVHPASSSRHYTNRDVAFIPLSDPWAQVIIHVCAQRFDNLSAHAKLFVSESEQQAALLRDRSL